MSGIVGANFLKESGLKRSHKFQRFTADGTWVKPSGITTVYIEVISSGSGGGAEETKITESLQCFYCAYAFKNGQIKKSPTDKQLETVKNKCYTTYSLKHCLEKGPVDWAESGVYVKTANVLQKEFGNSPLSRFFIAS